MYRYGKQWLLVFGIVATAPFARAVTLDLSVQSRNSNGEISSQNLTIDTTKTAIVAIDLWNSHPDPGWTAVAEAMIPRMNQTFQVARDLGMQVIFAPAGVVEDGYYDGNVRRQATMALPSVPVPPLLGDPRVPAPPYIEDEGRGAAPYTYIPPGVTRSEYPQPGATYQHPDVDEQDGPSDWFITPNSVQELCNVMAAKGITQLIYVGGATNWCIWGREAGIAPMVRRGLINTLFIRDLTEGYGHNGRTPGNPGVPDYSQSPDRATRDSVAFLEQNYAGSINARQLLAQNDAYVYSNHISGDPNLLAYWRMDGKAGYKSIKDIASNQGAWNADKVVMGHAGAIHGDSDTAAAFDGTAAIVASPIWQANLPTDSKLTSLSSGSFSVEAWVQVDSLTGSDRWIVSHDAGSNTTLDFSLGLSADGSFTFDTCRGTTPGGDPANQTRSALKVTQDDVNNDRWFHLVGVQDVTRNVLNLYINGILADSKDGMDGGGTALGGALILGGRGHPVLDGNGEVTGGISGVFVGVIDEVAIYSRPLSAQDIYTDYQLGTIGHVPEPSSFVLWGTGLLGLSAVGWWKRKKWMTCA